MLDVCLKAGCEDVSAFSFHSVDTLLHIQYNTVENGMIHFHVLDQSLCTDLLVNLVKLFRVSSCMNHRCYGLYCFQFSTQQVFDAC